MLKNSLVHKLMKSQNISREEAVDKLLDIRQRCVEAIDECDEDKTSGYMNAYSILDDYGLDEEDLDELI